MKLFTDSQREQLLANGRESVKASAAERAFDPRPVVKLFTPDANATWLLSELDPEDPNLAFGLCDLGVGCPELGYVDLGELTSFRGPLNLPIERDRHFEATQTLGAYAAAARIQQRIIT